MREPFRRRIANSVQEPADRQDGNTGKFCDLFIGKGLAKLGNNVECKPAVVAGQERVGFRETFAAGGEEIVPLTKSQYYLFTL